MDAAADMAMITATVWLPTSISAGRLMIIPFSYITVIIVRRACYCQPPLVVFAISRRFCVEWEESLFIQLFLPMHLKKVTFNHSAYPTTEAYPFNLRLLRETGDIVFSKPVTFFVGENGSGKTTVLKGICRRCGIHIWQDEERKRYRFNPFEEELYRYLDVEWVDGSVPGSYYDSQIFQDFTKFLDDWAVATPEILEYFGGDSLMTKSHGQSLMAYFSARYKIKGLYFLDEPEAALSPRSQLALLKLISRCIKGGNTQFIIASQSPILLAFPDAMIYGFDTIPLKPIKYEDTEHFQVYHDFLTNWRRYIADL